MVIFIVFGGVFTTESTVPKFLRWLPKASLIAQSFESLAVTELSGMAFDAPLPGDAATGEQVLRRMGLEGGSFKHGLSGLGKVIGAWCIRGAYERRRIVALHCELSVLTRRARRRSHVVRRHIPAAAAQQAQVRRHGSAAELAGERNRRHKNNRTRTGSGTNTNPERDSVRTSLLRTIEL